MTFGFNTQLQDKTAALRYIASTAGQGQAVKYVEDSSLPQGWRCQKIQNSIYYFSPRGERSVGLVVVCYDYQIVLAGLRREMPSLTGWRRRGPL